MPAGRLARFQKPLQTPEQRRTADVAAAHGYFLKLGWERTEVEANDVDRHLNALLARARAVQEHAKRLESLASPARASQQPPSFACATASLQGSVIKGGAWQYGSIAW